MFYKSTNNKILFQCYKPKTRFERRKAPCIPISHIGKETLAANVIEENPIWFMTLII